ncbi:response regulator [Pseudanabaena yagii GIHE-NHR1]|uniref:Response regulator n=2 Tax=Pseudanabaena TaxID=1152 RepID=A0ABX1M0H9_9CYAN|nr:response regulator [Pseudanabaena yagii GIHE-NHR1]
MDIITRIRPDVVIINLEIQDINDLEIIKQIRLQDYSDIPVIALSSPSDHEHYLNQGVDRCLVKPFKIKKLFQTIQSLLEK